jgi:hypothetical protein
MYDPRRLSPETVDWVCDEAMNELHAYLCEVDFRQMYGEKWPKMARNTAERCRAVAQAATNDVSKNAWLTLAKEYEGTISG